ncbi:MAG: hypothetical protein QOH12_1539 [Solirubrobacteraceae bacterium]|jgi:hypothetical protein|nr:hypothetical protein [Solirubrobacteraceae bacterium]
MPRSSLLVSVVVGLLIAPAATQASPAALISDCLTNGKIVGHYSAQDYTQALANLPTDVTEYSDCADVIRRAQLTAAAGGKTAAAAAASAPANPRLNPLVGAAAAEQTAIARARQSGAGAVALGGGRAVVPGVVAARTSSIFNGLPTPLLIALVLLLAIALALGGWEARKFVRARRAP